MGKPGFPPTPASGGDRRPRRRVGEMGKPGFPVALPNRYRSILRAARAASSLSEGCGP